MSELIRSVINLPLDVSTKLARSRVLLSNTSYSQFCEFYLFLTIANLYYSIWRISPLKNA
jgi:hypothetical protein